MRTPKPCRGEGGQSLPIIVISMTVIVLLAALAIDVSTWFVKHHKAQVTADAAALAAANYMSTGGSSGTATTTATTYASDNNLPISSSNVTVDTSSQTVTVTVPTTGPLLFAGIALGSGPSISARAVASWKLRDCTNAGSNCAFIYAADNVCTGDTGVTATITATGGPPGVVPHGVTIAQGGIGSSTTITGDIISNSNITTNENSHPQYNADAFFSPAGAPCGSYGGPTTASPTPYLSLGPEQTIPTEFPIPYQKVYTACPGTSTLTAFNPVTCVGTYDYPSYCTQDIAPVTTASATTTVSTVVNNAVYCDAGSGSPSDPSTWNGTLNVTTGGDATFIAGTVTFNDPSNTTLAPAAGNSLLAYGAECNATRPITCPASQTTSTSPVVNLISSGNATIHGDIFAPNGVIESNLGGTPTITGFLEGWDVVYIVNGTVTGQGPPVTPAGQFEGDQLIQ